MVSVTPSLYPPLAPHPQLLKNMKTILSSWDIYKQARFGLQAIVHQPLS